MVHTVRLFLPNDFYDELMYQYKGRENELRAVISSFLKPLGKQGRMAILDGTVQARIMVDGQMSMKEIPLKDIDMEKTAPQSDSDWIPQRVTKDEIKVYEIAIPDRLFKDLVTFGKVFCARLEIYNNTLDVKDPQYTSKVAKFPACFEQILQDNVITNLSQTLAGNIDESYDKEFAEIEKNIETKEPPKR